MASTTAPAAGKTTAIAPAQLHTFHKNPRQGDIPAIMASLRRHTQYKPITGNIGTHTGRPLEILAGNHTLLAFRALAEADPEAVEWQKVLVHWVDVDDDMADRIVVADNQTGSLGGFDEAQLAEIVAGFSGDIDGLGFTDADVDDLMALLEEQDLPPVSPQDDPMALPCADSTVTFFEGYRWVHGVTPITRLEGKAGYRISAVYYALRGMKNCREAAEEAAYGRQKRTEREAEMAKRLAGGETGIPTSMGSEKIEKQYGDRDHGADWRGMTGSQRHTEESKPKARPNRQAMSGWRGTGSGDRPWNSEQPRQ